MPLKIREKMQKRTQTQTLTCTNHSHPKVENKNVIEERKKRSAQARCEPEVPACFRASERASGLAASATLTS